MFFKQLQDQNNFLSKEKTEKTRFAGGKKRGKTPVKCSSRDRVIHAALHSTRGREHSRFHHLIPLQPPLPPPPQSATTRVAATRLIAPGPPRSPPLMFRGHAPLLHFLAGGGGGRRRRTPHRFAASLRRHPREHSFYLYCFLPRCVMASGC